MQDVLVVPDAVASKITWREPLIGAGAGILSGGLGSSHLGMSWPAGMLLGAIFGVLFGLFFSKQSKTPGAGLMWGISAAFLMWMLVPTGMGLLLPGLEHSGTMLTHARDHFPYLVSYLLFFGLPVGASIGAEIGRAHV